MKIYTKIVFDKDNNLIEEKYFEYSGSIALTKIQKLMKDLDRVKLLKKLH